MCRILDCQPVGQLHEHFGRPGLGRVDGAGEPVERLAFEHQGGDVGIGGLPRVGELRRDLFKAVDLAEVFLARDRCEEHFAAFLALAGGPDLDARGCCCERAEISVDVFRVGELLGGADDIAESLLGRGDGRGPG